MASRSPVFRVETYEISASEFTGTTYRLYLRHELSENYFPMVTWGVSSSGVAYALSELFVRVTADPYGTGDLSLADGNYLELTRGTATYACAIKVVVVECLRDAEGAGFTLLDVQAVTLAATASTGVQSTTDTSGTAWIDASRVTLFGGYRGGGLSSSTASSSSGQVQTGGCRIYPSSTATINIDRFASGASNLAAAVCSTFVVQWGFEWLVQRNNVTGTSTGATLASTSHYSTSALSNSVTRACSWVWACGYTNGSGPGDSFLGQVATIGDGVTQLTTETTVAVGGMATVTTRSVEVYTLSHPNLSAEYDFRATGSGAGASSLTVAAPGVAETYRTASGLYGVSTAGERAALTMAGVTGTTTSDMSEVLVSARPTASTTVTATPADSAPSLSWAGWNTTVDFNGIDTPAGKLPVFRVTTYRIPSGVFTGTTYDLNLLYDLKANYFVMVYGGTVASVTQDPDDAAAMVTHDPFGTGDLGVSSGSKVIRLARTASAADWAGEVVVVESTTDHTRHGFRLLDVVQTSLPAFTTPDWQYVEDTSAVNWSSLANVVLFGGWRGGGMQTAAAATTSQHNSLGFWAEPYGTNGIRLRRYRASNLIAVTACTYVVEFGTAWTGQRVKLNSDMAGSGVNTTNEYTVVRLATEVTVAQSMLFAFGASTAAQAGSQGYAGSVMLGDGVTVPTTATKVAWGSNNAVFYDGIVYVLTHADVSVDQDFISATGTVMVPSPARGEHYGTYNSVSYSISRRFSVPYMTNTATAATGTTYGQVYAYPSAYTSVTAARGRTDGISVYGWVHTFDLGGVTAESEAIQVNNDFDDLDMPVGYLVLQDPHWEGAGNIDSATSQAGAVFGLVEASSTNVGSAYAYQEGEPTGTTEITLRTQGGAAGGAGGYLCRLSTESTAASWRGMNALTLFTRSRSITTTAKLYAHGLAYSTLYDRVVWAWVENSTTIQVRYRASADPLATPTSTTITVEDADATGPNMGMAMCEVSDGSLLLVYQTVSNVAPDMNAYRSTDGGATWTLALRSVGQRVIGGAGYSGDQGQHVMVSSGDYVRLLCERTTSGSGTTTIDDYVSADRGKSWTTPGTLSAYNWTGLSAGFTGSTPHDVVGVGDVAGTFLWMRLDSVANSDTVRVYAATGTDAFALLSDLDFDTSGYATSPKVKGLWWCRIPDAILQFVWVEGSDKSDIYVRKADIADVTDPANWTTLGRITGFSGVLNYGPQRPRAVWAGSQVVVSAGIQDPDTATGGDALAAGHWSFTLGGWDTSPLTVSLADAGGAFYWDDDASAAGESDARMVSYQWAACLNEPDVDSLSPWTQSTSGVVVTTWTSDSVNLTTGSSTAYSRYILSVSPGSDADAWGYSSSGRGFTFEVRLKQTTQRSTSAEDCGIRIMAPTTSSVTTTGYDFTLRTATTQIVLYDNIAGSALATISTTDFASETEVRATIFGTSLWVKWRKVSLGPTGAWTEYGAYTLTSGSITGQLLRVGILNNPATAGTSNIDLYEVKVSDAGTDLGQRGDLTKPDDYFGALMTREPVLVAGGAWIGWGGGGAFDGDTLTATILYQRGITNLSENSPSYYWESTDLTQNALVFQSSADGVAGARWQVEAMVLVGTVDRTCTLEFSDSDSWTSPAASVELDATLWDDLTVVGVDGAAVQLEAATGEVFSPWRGELLDGVYLRFTVAGSASGKTYVIKADQFSDDGWVVVDGGADLATAGVTIGAKACVYADRMVFLGALRYRYRFFRLVFPDLSGVGGSLGTATGTHRLGALVPGHYLEFNRQRGPLQVEYTDVEEPVTTTSRSKSGVEHLVKDGPSTRSIGMLVTSVDPDAPTGSRGEVGRMIRDLLRVAHEGYTRPVALVMDSTWRGRSHVVYGVLNREGTTLDQGVPYKAEEGSRRFFTVGELALRLDEQG